MSFLYYVDRYVDWRSRYEVVVYISHFDPRVYFSYVITTEFCILLTRHRQKDGKGPFRISRSQPSSRSPSRNQRIATGK